MQVFFGLDKIPEDYRGAVVTLGVFDGLHFAHQEILRRVIRVAKASQAAAMMITFDPHPRNVLAEEPDSIIPLLTTRAEKIKLLKDTALDAILFLEVNSELLNTVSEKFVKNVLVDALAVQKVVIGYDYHFGKGREGRAGQLAQFGIRYGFEVETLPPIALNGSPVRSSIIRSLLQEGKVTKASRLLGRYYGISGSVVHGTGRGTSLGFPTANLQISDSDKMIPADGVYLTKVFTKEQTWFGLCNVGIRKTFGERERVVEVYLMNGDGINLYDSEINLEFLECLREEIQFPTVAELVRQMNMDKQKALAKIKNYL
jgi:riboflavin kinase/FMN adenylyltransferase